MGDFNDRKQKYSEVVEIDFWNYFFIGPQGKVGKSQEFSGMGFL